MNTPILTCSNLKKSYGNDSLKTEIIHGIQLELKKGIFYSIIGKSGCGKTTLLYLLSGLLKPDEGQVWLDGKNLEQIKEEEMEDIRRNKIGFVFQDYQLLPELTVKENILLPQILDNRIPQEEWINQILEKLGLSILADKFPYELSGGEQQRTAIGRAIVNRPDIIFADEPTGNLDNKTSEEVLDFLLSVHKEYHPAILMVTHDLDLARSAEVVFHMEDGRFIDSAKAGEGK